MIADADPTRTPTGVLVVTVWSDGDGLRRLVSLIDPEPHVRDATAPELQRIYAPSDTAVIALVKTWLGAVTGRSKRPVPHAVTFDPTAGSADLADSAPDG